MYQRIQSINMPFDYNDRNAQADLTKDLKEQAKSLLEKVQELFSFDEAVKEEINTVIETVNIKFEDKTKKRKYVGKTQIDLEDLPEKIDKILKEFDPLEKAHPLYRILESLKEEIENINGKDNYNNLIEYIVSIRRILNEEKNAKLNTKSEDAFVLVFLTTKDLKNYNKPILRDSLLNKIENLLSDLVSVATDTITLGHCSSNGKTITLYLNAIEQSELAKKSSLEDATSLVFWHELFHAFHFTKLKRKASGRNADIVMESLAEAFEYIMSYQIHNYSGPSRHILDECRIHSIKEWPYSGMVNIVENSQPCDLIKRILVTSLLDMDLACLMVMALEKQERLQSFLNEAY